MAGAVLLYQGLATMIKKPQVLLLGNGINRNHGGIPWEELLKDISVREDLPDKMTSPMPLQAMLRTNDDIKTAMRNKKETLFGTVNPGIHEDLLCRILETKFDEILTTNYSYELEIAAIGGGVASENQIKKLTRHTNAVARTESKYLLHSYNGLDYGGKENRIWHIHGEARKPDSMIIGHYYYANQLARIIQYIKDNERRYLKAEQQGETPEIRSWIDAFILGDVYVLGFGFDLSEFDLWWLLNRKSRERVQHGKTYFFEAQTEKFNEKVELLRLLDVAPIDCGFTKPVCDYPYFYKAALDSIIEMMSRRQG